MSTTTIEIIEETTDQPTMALAELQSTYQQVKKTSTQKTSELSENFTIEGMDHVNVMVADAMKKIDKYVNKGKEKSAFGKTTSKALAAVGIKNSWINTWIDNRKEDSIEEEVNNSTINEISQKLIKDIEEKRVEVIESIDKAVSVKKELVNNIAHYENILANAKALLTTVEENTKEFFDTQYLITMTIASLEEVKTDLKSFIDPLIASANLSVNQIQTILPTIESNLNSKLGFKTIQQKLTDLNQMTKAVSDLSANIGETVRNDINETIVESIKMLGNTGIDTDRLKQNALEQHKHQQNINAAMNDTQAKINRNFQDMEQLQIESAKQREATTNLLIENYSNVASKTA